MTLGYDYILLRLINMLSDVETLMLIGKCVSATMV